MTTSPLGGSDVYSGLAKYVACRMVACLRTFSTTNSITHHVDLADPSYTLQGHHQTWLASIFFAVLGSTSCQLRRMECYPEWRNFNFKHYLRIKMVERRNQLQDGP